MAWTAVHTFAVGDVLNASDLNTWLTGNTQFLFQPPSVSVTASGTQSIPDSSYTNLTFSQERFKQTDTGMHSNSVNTHELIAVTPGKYLVWAHLQFAVASSIAALQLRGNLAGSDFELDIDEQVGPSSGSLDMHVTKVVAMLAGDYVYLQGLQTNSGFNQNTTRAPQYSPEFGMTWIGN